MKDYVALLQQEVVPAFGCTEPIALAFAAAKAAETLGGLPEHIEARCSGNMIKNVKSVKIPNSGGKIGIEYSVLLGTLVGDSSKKLEVLENVTDEMRRQAEALYEARICKVVLAEGVENLFIEIIMTKGKDTARVILQNQHTNITLVEKNGEVLFAKAEEAVATQAVEMTFDSCFDFADTADLTPIADLMRTQLKFNRAIAEEGLKNNYGANIGKLILEDAKTVAERARAYAAAGSDARMGGCSMPVMINCGSGNQGITISVPIQIYAEEFNVEEERLLRALVLANLLAIYIKQGIGRLSAYCGVVSAASATSAGVAYLLGGNREVVWQTLSNALAGTSGVICDGAKASCAMKIGLSLGNAFLSYKQAKTDNSFSAGEGVVKDTIDETVATIGFIAKEGMKRTDVVILEKMIERK